MRALISTSIVLALSIGCGGEPPEGVYHCHQETIATDCPHGWYCRMDTTCWKTPDPPPDGGMSMRDAALDTNCAPSAEVCDGRDNDCDGMIDDGFPCAQGAPLSCTTSCGSMGTGVCSSTCTLPTGASCSPPTTESVCDGRDDNCNGVADEGLGGVGEPVTAVASDVSGAQLVATSTGYMLFYRDRSLVGNMSMQALDPMGTNVGSPIPLAVMVSTAQPIIAAAGPNFLIGTWRGALSLVGPDGNLMMSGALTPPGNYAVFALSIATADASEATVYATLCDPFSSPLVCPRVRRYRVNISASAPSVSLEGDVATTMSSPSVAVLSTSQGDYLAYSSVAGAIELVVVSPAGVASPVGTISSAGSVLSMAIANPTAPVSSDNSLAIVWIDGTARMAEIRGTLPYVLGTTLDLGSFQGGVIAATDDSGGTHSGHWWLADSSSAWEVVGGSGAPTGMRWTVAAPTGAAVTLANSAGHLRFAYASTDFSAVSVRLGCR